MARKKEMQSCEFDSLARFLLPAIRAFYEDEDNRCEFEAWQAERARRNHK